MTINIPLTNGSGTTLSNEIPTHLGKLKISCPVDLDRRSLVSITFVGNSMNIGSSIPLDPEGRTIIIDTDVGVVTGISISVNDPEGVTSMNVEFIEWTEEIPVI